MIVKFGLHNWKDDKEIEIYANRESFEALKYLIAKLKKNKESFLIKTLTFFGIDITKISEQAIDWVLKMGRFEITVKDTKVCLYLIKDKVQARIVR